MLVNHSDQHEDDTPGAKQRPAGHVLPHRKGRTLQPLTQGLQASHYSPVKLHVSPAPAVVHAESHQGRHEDGGAAAAIQLIRSKVAALYAQEPDVRQEIKEDMVQPAEPMSKHQRFMHELTTSGKPLAQIQTDWHNYYVKLPDHEKHEVWREFYHAHAKQGTSGAQMAVQLPSSATNSGGTAAAGTSGPMAVVGEHLPTPDYAAKKRRRTSRTGRPKSQIKKQILERVNLNAAAQAKARQQLQSLIFGLSTGFIVLLIFLFGFFNEMFIAPFIQPSRHVSATPIIVSSDSVAVSEVPEVIVPKINVQIPAVFDEKSADEAAIQRALERGVIHYPTTVLPGQQGNAAFFGHSSNNIFNKGKYKFAFVLLHELVPGDIFYLTHETRVFTYRVYDKRVVPPSEVSVLNSVPGKVATATLITCDPPGTSTNRLVVWGEQISPDPAGATAPAVPSSDGIPTTLPSEGPTLWTRFWRWVF